MTADSTDGAGHNGALQFSNTPEGVSGPGVFTNERIRQSSVASSSLFPPYLPASSGQKHVPPLSQQVFCCGLAVGQPRWTIIAFHCILPSAQDILWCCSENLLHSVCLCKCLSQPLFLSASSGCIPTSSHGCTPLYLGSLVGTVGGVASKVVLGAGSLAIFIHCRAIHKLKDHSNSSLSLPKFLWGSCSDAS